MTVLVWAWLQIESYEWVVQPAMKEKSRVLSEQTRLDLMSVYRCPTRSALHRKIGMDASKVLMEISSTGPVYRGAGMYAIVGPAPSCRRWSATVTVDHAGRITKVLG